MTVEGHRRGALAGMVTVGLSVVIVLPLGALRMYCLPGVAVPLTTRWTVTAAVVAAPLREMMTELEAPGVPAWPLSTLGREAVTLICAIGETMVKTCEGLAALNTPSEAVTVKATVWPLAARGRGVGENVTRARWW